MSVFVQLRGVPDKTKEHVLNDWKLRNLDKVDAVIEWERETENHDEKSPEQDDEKSSVAAAPRTRKRKRRERSSSSDSSLGELTWPEIDARDADSSLGDLTWGEIDSKQVKKSPWKTNKRKRAPPPDSPPHPRRRPVPLLDLTKTRVAPEFAALGMTEEDLVAWSARHPVHHGKENSLGEKLSKCQYATLQFALSTYFPRKYLTKSAEAWYIAICRWCVRNGIQEFRRFFVRKNGESHRKYVPREKPLNLQLWLVSNVGNKHHIFYKHSKNVSQRAPASLRKCNAFTPKNWPKVAFELKELRNKIIACAPS